VVVSDIAPTLFSLSPLGERVHFICGRGFFLSGATRDFLD
jgi:hypothetical protein